MSQVLVIAGTIDARQIVSELVKLNIRVAATVTTGFGSELLNRQDGVEIHEGKLCAGEMAELIRTTGACCLIDASHPYAREASLNAIHACEQTQVPYLRFEREETESSEGRVIRVADFEQAADIAGQMQGNIFLTIGSNHVHVFTKRISDCKNRLFARVLPDSKVMMKCEEAGLTAGNLIAMKGPFSEEMNIAMLKHTQAAVLVTKDSGREGGTGEKFSAAQKLNIPVIVVERPEVSYTRKVGSIGEVILFVKELLQKESR